MKQMLLALACLALGTATHAQTTSGKVIYEEAVSFTVPEDIPAEAAMLRDLFGNGMKFTRVLAFNQDAALYRSEKKEEKKSAGSPEDGMQVRIQMTAPEESTYTDLKSGATVEQRDLMGRKFLVSGEVSRRKWKMTGKQKTILNYPCQEAISYGKDTVIAWFTTAIPVSAGPQDWRGLPGLILEGSRVQKDGSFVIKATKVEEGGTLAIAAPKEGKKVSKSEFEKIQKEKEKEMMEEYGGGGAGGNRMIIHMER